MRLLSLFIFLTLGMIRSFAQPANVLKLYVPDCANAASAINYVLTKDPFVTLLFRKEYISDSDAVIEKFGLDPFRRNIIWSNNV